MSMINKSDKSIGILLHPTSIPGGTYCGTFGKCIEDWIDILSSNGISIWQFLPLSPTDSTGSPYSSPSSFALNPWFIDANELKENNYISHSDFINEMTIGIKDLDYFDFTIANKISRKIADVLADEWIDQPDEKKDLFLQWINKNK